MATKTLCILEPFFGGSHKQLIDTLTKTLDESETIDYDLFTLPAKKWPWKARCGALQLSEMIPKKTKYKTLFCSSDLSLSELIGIRPDLSGCHKVVYFHENQLVYPVQKSESLDFQFGYNQILTALAADEVCFNSQYNMISFLNNCTSFLRRIPGYKANNIRAKIVSKCKVLYFPLDFSHINLSDSDTISAEQNNKILHIVWAHRWEHDKDPDTFFEVLSELQENGFEFHVSVLGQGFTDVPEVFTKMKSTLKEDTIKNWGFVKDKNDYYSIVQSCDVAVSTAMHEFFGVSMMECVYCGCYPLCPNRLSYPELYPSECLYKTSRQLYKRLREFCKKPWLAAEMRRKLEIDFDKYSWCSKKDDYFNTLKL